MNNHGEMERMSTHLHRSRTTRSPFHFGVTEGLYHSSPNLNTMTQLDLPFPLDCKWREPFVGHEPKSSPYKF